MDNLNPNEMEIRFPYDGTYIDACVHDYTSTFKLICSWTHFQHRKNISADDIPDNEDRLKEIAIQTYWAHQLKNMEMSHAI